ncbi:DnaJ C-terminal domain-containing protein [Duganella sp. Root1480D1]|uniref:DnaJ C-terminal domain-containing protein n=1 Tax=Duganella sp. Root1480D1 TaxID=1736471 RepID=UPI00070FE7C2|nr:DnaJ C-terminal domain-containing protein [Duganella sp. Root1480D1]KQZ43889.1 cytochrome C biogenesis protein [Duganella sp. Root1480D1]
MEYKDYYATLGVAKTASEDEIKKAYRKLVRKYHPDVSKEADADARTKELNEAYGVLGDAEKRAAYDSLGSGQYRAGQEFRPPPDWSGGFEGASAEDFFADLFAHVGGQRGGRQGFRMRGDDIHAVLEISLLDAYAGAQREVSLGRQRNLKVSIPKGVTAGQQLRLGGQGQPGMNGAEAGDLYLEIAFQADDRYRVEGRDVYEIVPIPPWLAALGGERDVSTPSGRVTVTVPPNSQGGRKLRLKGRGIPAANNAGTAGDLYLTLEIFAPPADTPERRALYEQMQREIGG